MAASLKAREPKARGAGGAQLDLGPPLGAVSVRSVSREHRHTLAHTGLMLWEAAPALARLLLACPALCAGAQHNLTPTNTLTLT